jgi:hypothetical protein
MITSLPLLHLKPLARKLQRTPVLGDDAHDLVGDAGGNLGFDLQCHFDPCTYQPGQVSNEFPAELSGVAAATGGIQIDAAIALCLTNARRVPTAGG